MISQLVILLVALRLEGLPLRIFKGDIGNPGRGLNIQYLYYMYVINYVDPPIVSGCFNASADCKQKLHVTIHFLSELSFLDLTSVT